MFSVPSRQSMPLAVVRRPGSADIVHVQPLGSEQRYLVGSYELDILTLPRYRMSVVIEGGKVTELSIPAPGSASVTLKIASIGAILLVGLGGGGGLHLARFWRGKQKTKDTDTPS